MSLGFNNSKAALFEAMRKQAMQSASMKTAQEVAKNAAQAAAKEAAAKAEVKESAPEETKPESFEESKEINDTTKEYIRNMISKRVSEEAAKHSQANNSVKTAQEAAKNAAAEAAKNAAQKAAQEAQIKASQEAAKRAAELRQEEARRRNEELAKSNYIYNNNINSDIKTENGFTRITDENKIHISGKNGKTYDIDFQEVTKNFPKAEDKTKLIDALKSLPADVLADFATEIGEVVPAADDQYGVFYTGSNKMAVTLDDHAKYIITHELGHAVSTVKDGNENRDSLDKLIKEDSGFAATYKKELKNFIDAYRDKFGVKHVWEQHLYDESSTAEEGDVPIKEGYSASEVAATYYVLYTLGESDTEFAGLMAEKMPETVKALENIFEANRNKPDDVRKFDAVKYTYHPGGQVQTEQYYRKDSLVTKTFAENGNYKQITVEKNGVINEETHYYDSGNIKSHKFLNDDGTSYFDTYFDGGDIASREIKKDDMLRRDTKYYENGNMKSENIYDEDGTYSFSTYFENGNRDTYEYTCNYGKFDEFHSGKYYENGEIQYCKSVKGDNTTEITYYENGVKASKKKLVKDNLSSFETYYDTGKVKSKLIPALNGYTTEYNYTPGSKLESIISRHNDDVIGERYYYADGKIKSSNTVDSSGKRIQETYDQNGRKRTSITSVNDEFESAYSLYPDGSFKMSSHKQENGNIIADGWNSDGTQAYTLEIKPDGSVSVIRDIYAEDGTHTTRNEEYAPGEFKENLLA